MFMAALERYIFQCRGEPSLSEVYDIFCEIVHNIDLIYVQYFNRYTVYLKVYHIFNTYLARHVCTYFKIPFFTCAVFHTTKGPSI